MNTSSPAMFIGVQGHGIISFGSGQPDLPPPQEVYRVLPKFHAFKYGLIPGEVNLRKAVAKHHGCKYDHVVITNGASEALDLCYSAILRPKDKILLTKPYYYSYKPLVERRHAQPVFTELVKGKIDMDDVDKKIRGCKAFLINSPANPTGSVQTKKTIKQIEKLTKDLGIYLLSDEVYDHLIYDGEHYSPQGNHVININSFSKTFSMCGIRVGYCYTTNQILKDIIEIKTHSSMNTSTVAQDMALAALKVPKSYVEKELKIWRSRRNLIYGLLQDLSLDAWKPEGAFYVYPEVKNPDKVMIDLFKKHKVITYTGNWFGSNNRIRLSYALDEEKIVEGMKRIKTYLSS